MDDLARDIKMELFESQSQIIKLQSEAIDELFLLLMQFLSAEEADSIPAVAKINRAAQIKAEHNL